MDDLQYLKVKTQNWRGASTNFRQFEATPDTAAVQCIPSNSDEESDIYDLEEDCREDRVSNLPRKVRVNVLLAGGRKIK